MKKEKVLETVNELPQEFELDDLLEKLVFIEKVEQGLEQVTIGKVISHEEVKERVKKW
ncbi:MAG: hypothetical protein KA319_07970 [Ferruginibacter sp.]|nr:hypothetical protein [Ferruginibacter sp.]